MGIRWWNVPWRASSGAADGTAERSRTGGRRGDHLPPGSVEPDVTSGDANDPGEPTDQRHRDQHEER